MGKLEILKSKRGGGDKHTLTLTSSIEGEEMGIGGSFYSTSPPNPLSVHGEGDTGGEVKSDKTLFTFLPFPTILLTVN